MNESKEESKITNKNIIDENTDNYEPPEPTRIKRNKFCNREYICMEYHENKRFPSYVLIKFRPGDISKFTEEKCTKYNLQFKTFSNIKLGINVHRYANIIECAGGSISDLEELAKLVITFAHSEAVKAKAIARQMKKTTGRPSLTRRGGRRRRRR